MASYFDLPPQQNAAPANIESVPEEQRKQLGRMSVLSPAVTQLLDDIGDDASDSESEEGGPSEPEDTKHPNKLTKRTDASKARQDKGPVTNQIAKSALSPKREGRSANSKSPSARAGSGSPKPKQPHMARFHSLRSMLFSNTIEDKMKKMTQEDYEKEEAAANKWKNQHAQRQMPSRPKTPEKDAQGKPSGLGSRLKMSIRRITTKDVPTMETLNEDGAAHDFSDHGSTASSDGEAEPYQWKPREADEESIDHSDVEDIKRWVSRRDPPSDGEARASRSRGPAITLTEADTGHDSMGDSDVDDLVHWASRKSLGPVGHHEHHAGYSDASTESDSEMIKDDNDGDSSEDEDAEDLVRWVSHREGPTAGPVRQKRKSWNDSQAGSSISYDSDVPELGRWVKRHDGTSGESGATTPARGSLEVPEPDEPERGRPRSREGPTRPTPKNYITHEDINELVSWVSRKDSKQQSPPEQGKEVEELQAQEEAKKKQLGMTVDVGSLSHSDVKDLIEHVKHPELAKPNSDKPGRPESGALRRMCTNEREAVKPAAQDHLKESRNESKQIDGEDLGTTTDGLVKSKKHRDSLKDDDVDELVKWVSRKG
jgi:hypothetical protein